MADLFSLSMRLTSGRGGRPAMRAISSGNSYQRRPHCTRRAASATTCSRVASAALSRPDGAAGAILLGAVLPAGFGGAVALAVPSLGGCLAGLAAGLGCTPVLRSVRAICDVPVGGGVRLVARNFGISRLPG